METRPVFILGDIASNAIAGAFVGFLSALIFGTGWPMILAMIVGMVLGMILSAPFAFGCSALCGAMEVMLPVMMTGMVAGMVVSMKAASVPLGLGEGAMLGVWSGLGVFVAIYILNALMKSEAEKWTK